MDTINALFAQCKGCRFLRLPHGVDEGMVRHVVGISAVQGARSEHGANAACGGLCSGTPLPGACKRADAGRYRCSRDGLGKTSEARHRVAGGARGLQRRCVTYRRRKAGGAIPARATAVSRLAGLRIFACGGPVFRHGRQPDAQHGQPAWWAGCSLRHRRQDSMPGLAAGAPKKSPGASESPGNGRMNRWDNGPIIRA